MNLLQKTMVFVFIVFFLWLVAALTEPTLEVEEKSEVITCIDEPYTHMGRQQIFRVCIKEDKSFTIDHTSSVNEDFYKKQLSLMKEELLQKL